MTFLPSRDRRSPNESIGMPAAVWAAIANTERASIARLVYELRKRAVAARESRSTNDREELTEQTDALYMALVEALRAARYGP